MKKIIIRLALVTVGLGVVAGVVGTSILIYFSFGLPKISTLNDYNPAIPSKILSKDGHILAELGRENRNVAKFEEIPKRIVDAFLSAEDDSFYEHRGVDYMGVFRAFVANLKAGRVVQGGSTITQQVAKTLLLTREQSISRKIKDFLLAQRIEEKFSKEEILYLYLNQVYLGGGYYGVKSAFDGYFGKELSEATVAEASMVAGLLVAPGRYSPYINPSRAKSRQKYVLTRMLATGKINEQEYKDALAEKTQFRIRDSGLFKAGYFTDWVRQRIVSLVGENEFLTQGFTVETTLNYELQKIAEKEVKQTVKAVDKRQGYKGPLKNLKNEEIEKWRQDYLKEFYKDQSNYFVIDANNEKQYELELKPEELMGMTEYRKEFRSKVSNKRFIAGNAKECIIKEHLKYGESYKALVLHADDWARVIYVDVGGSVGIIPYEMFRWAHERSISENREFYPYITKPSQIVKKGDIVLVEHKGSDKKLIEHTFGSGFNNYIKKLSKSARKMVYSQRYELYLLDQEPEAEGALVSLDPESGEMVSLVGGYDFSKSQFNRALQSKRQPGSAFKPILFAAALENGYTPSTIIVDSPETLAGADDSLNWKPRNYDGKYKGPVTVRTSLEHSRNVPTIKMAYDLGVQKIIKFVNRIGLEADMAEDLSLALGSFGVTLLDIVSTYGIFPNAGKIVTPKTILRITDRNGNIVEFNEINEDLSALIKKDELEETKTDEDKAFDEAIAANDSQASDEKQEEEQMLEKKNPFLEHLDETQVYDKRLAYVMSNLLRGVVLYGTGRGTKSVSQFLGGKTGTTNNYVDAWFIGFSQNLVTGVWTGFDENQTLGWGETGAKAALPVWRDFMRAGLKKYGEYDFKVPQGIVNVLVNKETGKPASYNGEGTFLESFAEGTEPGAAGQMADEKTMDKDPSGLILEEDDFYSNQ